MESLSRDSKRDIQGKLNDLSDLLYKLSVQHDKELESIEAPEADTKPPFIECIDASPVNPVTASKGKAK
jgi:hypothetical protein